MSEDTRRLLGDINRRLSRVERNGVHYRISDIGDPTLVWQGGSIAASGADGVLTPPVRINSDDEQSFIVSTGAETWRQFVSDRAQAYVRKATDVDLGAHGFDAHLVANQFTPTAFRTRISILGEIRNSVESGGTYDVDCVGVYGRGHIGPGKTYTHTWGGAFEVEWEDDTSDGQAIACEMGIKNEGSVVTTIDDVSGYTSSGNTSMKVVLWLRSYGTNKVTALIANTSTSAGGAHYGIHLRSIAYSYLRLQSPASGAFGIEFINHANWGDAIRLPNDSALVSYNAAGNATVEIARVNASDDVEIAGLVWNDTLPWAIDIDPFLTPHTQTNWSTLQIETGQLKNGRVQTTVQNGEIGWDVVLAAGTWDLRLLVTSTPNSGIITASLDGSSIGTMDTYSAGVVNNVRVAVTGVTVATAGKKRLLLKTATKNASAGNYYGLLTSVGLRRTA